MEHLDVAFGFELYHADWAPGPLRAALDAALSWPGRMAWVTSNHDFSRLASRVGEAQARAAALLLLTLPGPVFVYQGDELGQVDGPGADPPDDRAGRDPFRHPMAWDGSIHGGFSDARPWLEVAAPREGTVEEQWERPDSILRLYRDVIELRRGLQGSIELLDGDAGVVALRRGEHVIALNPTGEPAPAPAASRVLRHTNDPALTTPPAVLGPGEGFVAVS